MAPLSQKLEPPANPGRFNVARRGLLDKRALASGRENKIRLYNLYVCCVVVQTTARAIERRCTSRTVAMVFSDVGIEKGSRVGASGYFLRLR